MSPAAPARSDRSEPRALIVLGMHRSGTSALTRVLNLLGAALPQRLMPPLDNDNPAGFWESEHVAAISDRVLQHCGSSWEVPLALPDYDLDSPAIQTLIERAVGLLKSDFASKPLFVLKDPRFCRTLPFWHAVLERFGVRPAHVLIVRHPFEVERSLNARQGLAPVHAHFLWLRYNLEAERHSRGQPRSFVSYDQVMSDWRLVISRIEQSLELIWPHSVDSASEAIDAFLDPALRHHTVEAGDELTSEMHPWVETAFDSLDRAVTGDTADLVDDLDQVSNSLAVNDRLYDALAGISIGADDRKSPQLARIGQRSSQQPATLIDSLERQIALRDFELERQGRELQSMESRLLSLTKTLDEQQAKSHQMFLEVLRAAHRTTAGEAGS